VVLVTGAEADLYRRSCPGAPVETIPNGVDLNFFRPTPATSGPSGCVFVGQLDYRANVLGLEWFCREVWPAIRAQRSEATFEIVGRNPTAAVRSLGTLPGVWVVGPVADVRPRLACARVVVVPLPVARGVQNKVLEALAMGRAVVASPAALEGLDLVPGRDALVAASGDDWARCIAELWDDPDRRDELGRNGRRFVETHHHWETCLGRFDELIGAKVGTSPAGMGVRTC
jgi:glycosyltransferase involved in cell wall biosynthesis